MLMVLFTTIVSANTPLNKIVVFGDSLSDNGNFYEYFKHQYPPSPPYYEGRFTNGLIWAELLIQSYYQDEDNNQDKSAKHLFDYAYGGASVLKHGVKNSENVDSLFTLKREIKAYLREQETEGSHDQTMYVVWIGSNDYLTVLDEVTAEGAVRDVNKEIQNSLKYLADNVHPKYIMIVDLPDLGKTPLAKDMEVIDLWTTLSEEHNQRLLDNIAQLKTQYPNTTWLHLDVNETFKDIIANKEKYGFENVEDTCHVESRPKPGPVSIFKMVSSIKPKQLSQDDGCDGYLFFDGLHPSRRVHQLIAKSIQKLFDENNIVFK